MGSLWSTHGSSNKANGKPVTLRPESAKAEVRAGIAAAAAQFAVAKSAVADASSNPKVSAAAPGSGRVRGNIVNRSEYLFEVGKPAATTASAPPAASSAGPSERLQQMLRDFEASFDTPPMARLQLTPAQAEQAQARLFALAKDPAALEAALGEKGWSLQARFAQPQIGKDTYMDAPSGSSVRIRLHRGEPADSRFILKPPPLTLDERGVLGGGIGAQFPVTSSLKQPPQADLQALLSSVAKEAPVLKPVIEVDKTWSTFSG